MADAQTALLGQALLAAQKRRPDPLDNFRKFGTEIGMQGASTAPVRSPMEGLARALQGGLGGLMTGYANYKTSENDKNSLSDLTTLASANSPEELNAGLATLKNRENPDLEILAPLISTMLAKKQEGWQNSANATGLGNVYGMAPPSTGAPQTAGAVPPLPVGTPQGFDNNLGNIRATPINWQDKGQPQGGFETFKTPQAGANAMATNLQAYIQSNPNITVAQAIAKWAPPNENDTNTYIKQVAEGTGINPSAPLGEVMKDPAVGATLMDAITRKEKGGLPAGVSADTFMAANGAPQPIGSADGSGTPAPPPGAAIAPTPPAVPNVPRPPPSAETISRVQQLVATGALTKVQGVQEIEKERDRDWAVAQKRADQAFTQQQGQFNKAGEATEHDRRVAMTPPNAEQSLSAGFADRMANSNGIVTGLPANVPTSQTGRILDKAVPFGMGNFSQTGDYQKYLQARSDFINAQLRRESGAAIAPSEYENADKQYFPQPGDKPEVIEQKAKNRALAIEGMKRNAGNSYQPSPTVSAPQAAPPSSGGVPQIKSDADYSALKPGQQYKDPEGNLRVKGGG